MSRSFLPRARAHRRAIVVGASICALATAGALTAAGAANASGPDTTSTSCSTGTLAGTYLFEGNGVSVSGTTSTPTAFAGSEHFNGAGAVAGSSTFSSGGTIFPRSSFTGTYALSSDCTGTLTIGTTLHFDIYVAPSGNTFRYVQTDHGSVSAATESRVSH